MRVDAGTGMGCIALVVVILAYLWTGSQDYADAQADQLHTCQMVADRSWPPGMADGLHCPERIAGVER